MQKRKVMINPEALCEGLDQDRIIVFYPERYVLLVLTATGAYIWRVLREPRTCEDVCRMVQMEYGKPRNEVREDVDTFLEQLRARGLLICE